MQKIRFKAILQKCAALGCTLLFFAGLAACSTVETQNAGKAQNTAQSDTNDKAAAQSAGGTDMQSADPADSETSGGANAMTLPDVNAMSVNEALSKLQTHYGENYTVNGRVPDGDSYSFQVFFGDTLYARVVVNLTTGKATETRNDTGEQSVFTLTLD